MTYQSSLRARLMVLILAPLTIVALLLGYWRYAAATSTAEELFDRSLLSVTLAISRDVTVSGGDALSITTRDLISEAAGGQVFYHVSGPDHTYITGYAYPPVPPSGMDRSESVPTYYESLYHRSPVRALRLLEPTEIGPFQGLSTVTVWQRSADREAIARGLALQSAALLCMLLCALAVITWFAINRGLRPLMSLEEAIAARSSNDLSRIRREVPTEVRGIVSTLNDLFGQVRSTMQARDAFISDAAHQLRNPIAGLLALAEAAETAKSDTERLRRVGELRHSAARTARLTTQMLTYERSKGQTNRNNFEFLDLCELATHVATRNADRALTAGIAFEFTPLTDESRIQGDRLMLEEAVENLIDNAMRHGPPALREIKVSLSQADDRVILTVSDDGTGLSPEDAPIAFERFSQVRASDGSGLGLAIVAEIAKTHGAELSIDPVGTGASVSIAFDLVPAGTCTNNAAPMVTHATVRE